jgi:hypothetical protein
MSRTEKALVLLLRLSAALLLLATVAVFMPHCWMAAIHRAIIPGELPAMPIVGYLTRSLSAMYALHGALLLYLSFNVRRYLPLVQFLAVLSVVFGCGMIVLDCAVGLPLCWILSEGPLIALLGGVLLWLARRVASHRVADF